MYVLHPISRIHLPVLYFSFSQYNTGRSFAYDKSCFPHNVLGCMSNDRLDVTSYDIGCFIFSQWDWAILQLLSTQTAWYIPTMLCRKVLDKQCFPSCTAPFPIMHYTFSPWCNLKHPNDKFQKTDDTFDPLFPSWNWYLYCYYNSKAHLWHLYVITCFTSLLVISLFHKVALALNPLYHIASLGGVCSQTTGLPSLQWNVCTPITHKYNGQIPTDKTDPTAAYHIPRQQKSFTPQATMQGSSELTNLIIFSLMWITWSKCVEQ